MKYRVTNQRGKTIGYVRDQSLDLLGVLIVGVVVVAMGIVILPIYVVIVGVQTVLPWYLMFWDWASNLPLTPFPNLNGMIIITAIGVTGGVIHQFLPLHILLFYAFGNVVRLLVLDVILGIIGLLITFVGCGLIIGLTLGLPISLAFWLFTTTGGSLWYFLGEGIFSPVVVPVAWVLHFIKEYSWYLWVAPIFFPLSRICGSIAIVSIIKLRRMKIVDKFIFREEAIKSLYTAIASWLGMVILQASIPGLPEVALFVFGTLLGVMIWGGIRGIYRIASGTVDGTFEEYCNAVY